MMVCRAALVAAVFALCALTAAEVRAQPATPDSRPQTPSKWRQSETVWKGMDNCKRQAWKQYPDYTAEGNAKRAHAEKLCLSAHNLPPGAPPGERSGSSGPPNDAR